MTADNGDRIEALFHQAADLPPEEWQALLDAACADDPGLRAAVERLLANDARLGAAKGSAFLKSPLRRSTAESPTVVGGAEPPGVAGSVAVPGYEIESVLGRGGMGVVYKARHLALNRTVALKMVLAGGHAGPQELARFRLEAEAVARLQHPNIVQIHEVGEANGHPYCALEFVEGGSLSSKLTGKPLPAREAAKLAEALARG